MICNPSTGQSLVLPKVKTRRVGVRSLFGYDPIGKEFKVLSMTRSGCNPMCEEHQVLTLGTGKRSWRMIECCVPHYYYPHKQICIDGVLYYPSFNRDKETYLIVCFDVRSETFSVIKVKEPLYLAVYDGTLVNCNGKFGLVLSEGSACITREKKSFQLWVLEDIEKQEWSEHTYLLPSLWNNMDEIYLWKFVGMTRTNEIVLLSYPTYYLFYFNLETKNIARVEFRGMDLSKYAIHGTFTNHLENVKLM